MSELIRGYSTPLFDRLSAATDKGGVERLLLTQEQLEISIGRELSNLMNTRSRLTSSEFLVSTGSCIDYGVPDHVSLSTNSSTDMALLQSIVEKAIKDYEPRLNDVTVQAVTISKPRATVMLLIRGSMTIELKLRQLDFELQLDSQQGNLSRIM